MAICLIIWKFIKLKLAINRLKREKANAYRKSINLPPKYGCCEQLFRWIFGGLKNLFLYSFCWCLICKFGKEKRSKWELLWTDGTLANSILKSFAGLMFGLCFTHFLTLFLIFQLNFDPVPTTYGCLFFGLILTLGLAFSKSTRCFVFLSFPQFFTKKGRAAILAYCFILALSGPGKNTTTNMEILTESLICGQQMARNATQGLIDLVKDPLSALGATFQRLKDAIVEASNHVKNGIAALIRAIMAVVNVIKEALKWLKKITSVCNKKLGTPFERCITVFDTAIAECKAKMGALDWMCSVVSVVEYLCHVAKIVDLLCWLPSLIKEAVFSPIQKELAKVKEAIKTFFDVRLNFTDFYKLKHSFNSSKSFHEVVHDMKSEIVEQVHWFLQYMDWVNLLVSMFMFLALYKALVYRFRFLHSERHDNFYITKGLVRLDLTRRRLGKETVFPLKYRESYTYIQTFSFVLLEPERKALKFQLAIVAFAAVKICTIILIDYCFYRFLLLVKMHGAIRLDTREILGFNVKVRGEGFMADMYRAILFALSPIGDLLPVFDTTPCLPIPVQPNYYEYAMIIFLLAVCFIACITEPYGMRLRHIICEMYYPERKLPRVRWLYQHILSARGNFLMYARSQLKAKKGVEGETYEVGILDRLSHTIPCFRWVLYFFGARKKKCFLCGKSGEMDNMEDFVHCPGCESVFCNDCYEEIEFRCVACMSPIEFGDVSEESGSHSSDEDSDDNADVEANQRNTSLAIMDGDERKTSSAQSKTLTRRKSSLRTADQDEPESETETTVKNFYDTDASTVEESDVTLIDLEDTDDDDEKPAQVHRISKVRFDDFQTTEDLDISVNDATSGPDTDAYVPEHSQLITAKTSNTGRATVSSTHLKKYALTSSDDAEDEGDEADEEESEGEEIGIDTGSMNNKVRGSRKSSKTEDGRNIAEYEGDDTEDIGAESDAFVSNLSESTADAWISKLKSRPKSTPAISSEESGSESSSSGGSSAAAVEPKNKSNWLIAKLKNVFGGKSVNQPTTVKDNLRRVSTRKNRLSDQVELETEFSVADRMEDESDSENESDGDSRSSATLLRSPGRNFQAEPSGLKQLQSSRQHGTLELRSGKSKAKGKTDCSRGTRSDNRSEEHSFDGSEIESSRPGSYRKDAGPVFRRRRPAIGPIIAPTDSDSNSEQEESHVDDDSNGEFEQESRGSRVRFAENSNSPDVLDDGDNLDDPDGTCHHHQGVDEDVYDKYSDVISEFTETLDGNSKENSENSEDEQEKEERRIDPHSCTRSCRRPVPIDLPDEDEDDDGNRVEEWADAAATSTLRRHSRNLHPCISATVDQLDSYYTGMPYPPHTNVYKNNSGQY